MSSLPRSIKLDRFFSDLRNPSGRKILQVLGDSINSVGTTNRMHEGYRDSLPLPWNGHVQGVDTTNFWGYANRQGTFTGGGVNAVVSPLAPAYTSTAATILTDVAGKMPLRWAEAVWTVAPTNCGDNSCAGANLLKMEGLNPQRMYMQDGASAISARIVFFEHTRLFSTFNVKGYSNGGSGLVGTTAYTKPVTPSEGLVAVDVSCGTPTIGQLANVRITDTTGFSAGVIDSIPLLCTRFRDSSTNGVQLNGFISHGGFTTGDHITTTAWSDLSLEQYYNLVGIPTHMMLWIGQNSNDASRAGLSESGANGLDSGSGTNYKANLLTIIARHEARIANVGGSPPLWLLVTQYKTGHTSTFYETMAAVHKELAETYPRICWVNLYRLAGGANMNTTSTFMLSDVVHPNANGVQYFTSLIWQEALRATIEAGYAANTMRIA